MTPDNKDVAGLLPSSEGAAKLLAAEHIGMRVDYSGLLKQAQAGLRREPALAEMLRQLKEHLTELGRRWYAGDVAVVDEILQLYCIEKDARSALAAPGAAIAAREQPMVPMAVSVAISAYGDARADDDGTSAARMGECITEIRKALGSVATPLASRQEAPVASGEVVAWRFPKAGIDNGYHYVDSLSGEEERFKDKWQPLCLASPSGAGLGGAVASSEAVTEVLDDWDRRAENGAMYTEWTASNCFEYCAEQLRAALASQPGCAVEGEAVAAERERCATCADDFAAMMEQGAGEHKPGGRLRQLARKIRDGGKPLGYDALTRANSTEMTEGATRGA